MGFLGVLGPRRVFGRRIGQELTPEAFADEGARIGLGGFRHIHRVGPHVGDQTGRAGAGVHAFVQGLSGAHGPARVEIELAARFLLEGAGDERGRGFALAVFAIHPEHNPVRAFERGEHALGVGLIPQIGIGAAHLEQTGDEGSVAIDGRLGRALGELGFKRPVLDGDEPEDFPLALDHEAEGDGLHPPRAQAAPAELVADQGAEAVTHQAIENAAGLLRVDLIRVDFARMGKGMPDRVFGDFVELDPAHGLASQFGLKRLAQMPGDGLALAVGVGGKPDLPGIRRNHAQFFDGLALGHGHDIGRLEVMLEVDPKAALGQVANMTDRRAHRKLGAQELPDGLGLGGGFDDDQGPALCGVPCPIGSVSGGARL